MKICVLYISICLYLLPAVAELVLFTRALYYIGVVYAMYICVVYEYNISNQITTY